MSVNNLRTAVSGGANVPAKKQPDSFPAMIDSLKKQVALALPKHLNADRMARIALTEFNKNPQLAKCEPRSVFASVIIASQLGLEPGIMGQAYLIPYKDHKAGKMICQFIPGWQGLVDLAQRSGRSSVWTGAVFEGDDFDYEFGSDPFIKHKPRGARDPEKLLYTYSVGWVKGADRPVLDVWTADQVWEHRDRFNKVGDRHYSFNHPEMYARKIPLLQVLKYLPKSAELALGVDLEHAALENKQRLDIKEAIDGTFSVADDDAPPAGEAGGGMLPNIKTEQSSDKTEGDAGRQAVVIDVPGTVTALRAATSTKQLKEMWQASWVTLKAKGVTSMPLDIEAVYNEMLEALTEREREQI